MFVSWETFGTQTQLNCCFVIKFIVYCIRGMTPRLQGLGRFNYWGFPSLLALCIAHSFVIRYIDPNLRAVYNRGALQKMFRRWFQKLLKYQFHGKLEIIIPYIFFSSHMAKQRDIYMLFSQAKLGKYSMYFYQIDTERCIEINVFIYVQYALEIVHFSMKRLIFHHRQYQCKARYSHWEKYAIVCGLSFTMINFEESISSTLQTASTNCRSYKKIMAVTNEWLVRTNLRLME